MNLGQLRVFHAVATYRGFSAAAQTLGVTQPAVTQHIRALEDALGTRLFTRRGGTVELTAEGRSLLPQVHRAVMALDELGTRISAGKDLRVGHLSIGICAPFVVMPILRRFMAEHPGIQVDVRLDNSSRLLDLVANHTVDLAIATMTEPNPDFVCSRLVDQQVLVLISSDHPWSQRRAIAVEELTEVPFVMRELGSMTRQIFEQGLADAGVEVDVRLVLGSREAVKEAVAAGLGCGIVLDRELGSGHGIRGVRVAGVSMKATEYIVALPEIASLGAAASFIAIARSIYDEAKTLPVAGE